MLKTMPPREVFDHLAVVRFRSSCRSSAPEGKGPSGSVLGFTHVSDGDIMPFIDVACNQVRRWIRPLVAGEGYPRMELLLGRALARVLAHELYHVLAETSDHGHHGIAKPALTAQELVQMQLSLHDDDSRRIRDKILPEESACGQ